MQQYCLQTAQHSHSHLPFWFYSQEANRHLRPEAHRELPMGVDSLLLADSHNQGESGQEAAGRAVLGCNFEMTDRLDLAAEERSWWRDSNCLAAGDTRLVELQVEESL